MSIQYTVPGFKPMTFGYESLPITTRPGLPPNKCKCYSGKTFLIDNMHMQLGVCQARMGYSVLLL